MDSKPPLPSVQTAYRIVRKGDPATALVKDDSTPVPVNIPKGQVLIKVQAVSLNPVCALFISISNTMILSESLVSAIHSGYKLMRLLPNSLFGRIAENDFAGAIVDPNGCDRFKVGDQVFGSISSRVALRTGHGALAQYTAGPAETIVHRPENIPVKEASGITIVAVTAYQALFDVGKLQPGQKVFINGGSTSVGIYAIQFAKAIGCEVHASASGKNEDFLKSLGVDEVPRCCSLFSQLILTPPQPQFVDYTNKPIHEVLTENPPSPKFDILLEAVGIAYPSLYRLSENYLAPNGTYVSVGPTPDGLVEASSLLWNAFIKPGWAGGVRRKFK